MSIHVANIADVHARRAPRGPGIAQPGGASWLEFGRNKAPFQQDGPVFAGAEWH